MDRTRDPSDNPGQVFSMLRGGVRSRVQPFAPWLRSAVCLLFLAGCGDTGDPGPDPTPTPDPSSIGYQLLRGIDRLDQPRAGVARLFSSHNPNDALNDDHNRYLRREADGAYVLAEQDGPGVITRLWMTARVGTLQASQPGFWREAVLKVYTDGDPQPLFSVQLVRFFAGELFPFQAPLVGQHSSAKGFFSYVPISFARSVKVTVSNPVQPFAGRDTSYLFYQINLLDLRGQAPVLASPIRQADGSLALRPEDRAAHEEGQAQWRDPLAFANRMTEARQIARFSGPLQGTALLANLTGPGRIRGIRLQTAGIPSVNLESVRLRIRWDGEATPSVDIPLGTGWGLYFNRATYQGLAQGALPDGMLYLRLPMPFRQSASLELVNQGSLALPLQAEVFHDPGPVPGDARYLHAAFTQARVPAGVRHGLAQAAGTGHIVGLQLVMDIDADPHALEGDEFIQVDGQSNYEGTGTEDFFNAHWYFAGGPRGLPLHGTTAGSAGSLHMNSYRWLIPDLIPFGNQFRFELENGNVRGQVDSYRSVVFYYLAQ